MSDTIDKKKIFQEYGNNEKDNGNYNKDNNNHKILVIKIAYLGGPGWTPFRQGSDDAAWKGHSGLARAWNGRLGAPNKEIDKKSQFGG